MRFDEQVHWSEGLFLQPQHFQQMQNTLESLSRKQRKLVMPFDYGFSDLELDFEALKSRRIVVKNFSAVLPDGQEISMPGNCNIAPLTLEMKAGQEAKSTIYLIVPLWSNQEPNLSTDGGQNGRYVLHETKVTDENTSDNEIPLMVRRYNASLVTDVKNARNCAVLPLCRVNWVVINASLPSLEVDDSFMPPYITLSRACPLLAMSTELLFQLRSARSAIFTEFQSRGFDPKLTTAPDLLKLTRLASVNRAIRRLDAKLVPDRITPFELYIELVTLLSDLESENPTLRANPVPKYNHDDLKPVVFELLSRIRAILLQGGVSSALSFAFTDDSGPFLDLKCDDERVYTAKNIFLAIEFIGNLRDRVADVENGDNFRLIDKASFTDRVRGVKLAELRFPPHYLPNLPNTLWFKVMNEESPRIWHYITKEHEMIIDSAHDMFPNLKATLYVSVEETASGL